MTSRVLWIAAIVALGIAFGPFLCGDFVWDDAHLIRDNPLMTDQAGWMRLLTSDVWGPATGRSTQLYHPVPMLSIWAQVQSGTGSVVGLRIGNVVVHAVAVALFGVWLHRRGLQHWTATLTALTVLVHPTVTEPVMWITGRHDSLAVVAVLGALLAWPARAGAPAADLRALGAGVLAALAFLCKEPYIVAPLLLIGWHSLALFTQRRRPTTRDAAWVLAATLPLGLAIGWRLSLGISLASSRASAPLPALSRDYPSIVVHYLVQLVTFGNGPTLAGYVPLGPWASVLALTALVATTAALVRSAMRRGGPLVVACFGWGWFLVSLAPHVISVPTLGLYANRYGYFGLFGLATCLGSLVEAVPPKAVGRTSGMIRVAALAAILVLSLVTASYARNWRSNLTLFGADVDSDPRNGFALYHLGTAVLADRGCPAALPLFERAARLAPGYDRPWHNAAGCLIRLGRLAEARPFAARAVSLAPGDPRRRYNLGVALMGAGEVASGVRELEVAVALDPTYEAARQALDRARAMSGKSPSRAPAVPPD
jgi:protein O-mannosyl-transferase